MRWGDEEKSLAIHVTAALILLGLPMTLFQWPLGFFEFLFLIPLQSLFNRYGWNTFLKGMILTILIGTGLFVLLGQVLGMFTQYPSLGMIRSEDLLGKSLALIFINLPQLKSIRNLYKILVASLVVVLIKIGFLLHPSLYLGWQEELTKLFSLGLQSLPEKSSLDYGSMSKINIAELTALFIKLIASCLLTLEFVFLCVIVQVGKVWAFSSSKKRSYFQDFYLSDKTVWLLIFSLIWVIFTWFQLKSGGNSSLGYFAYVIDNFTGIVLLIFSFKGMSWLQDFGIKAKWGPGLTMLLNFSKFLLMAWTIVFCCLRGMNLAESWPALILPLIGSLGIWIKVKDFTKERG